MRARRLSKFTASSEIGGEAKDPNRSDPAAPNTNPLQKLVVSKQRKDFVEIDDGELLE